MTVQMDRALLVRRIMWASRRGTLELDLFLSDFLRDRVDLLTVEVLKQLHALLALDDTVLADVLSLKEQHPLADQFLGVLAKIKQWLESQASVLPENIKED